MRKFVDHLGYKISSPKWQERPDALLTLSNPTEKKRTAIEVTDHYNDTVAGRVSPRTPIDGFWRLVEASLMRRISHRKHLTGIVANVRFPENVALPSANNRASSARALASEIVMFAESHPIKPGQSLMSVRKEFVGYPTAMGLLTSLRLARSTEEFLPTSRCSWRCANLTTGHVAVSLNYIKAAITIKNNKAVTYENWGKAEQKWLLIVAGGGNVSTHAPRRDIGVDWNDQTLIQLCKDTPFDGIVFWEPVGHWHRWLKK